MPTPSKKVLVPVSLLKRVIRFALVVNDYQAVQQCLYCTWSTPYISNEETNRLLRLPREEQQEWDRQFYAAQQHDKNCVVTRSRKALGLPNPRAVYYVPTEKDEDDEVDG